MGLRFHRKCDEKGDLLGKGRVVHWEPTSSGGFWVLLLSRSSDEAFHSLIFSFVFFWTHFIFPTVTSALFGNVMLCISNSEKCFCMGLRFDAAGAGIASKGYPSDRSPQMRPLLPQREKNPTKSRQHRAFVFIGNGGLAVFQELQVHSTQEKVLNSKRLVLHKGDIR